MPDSTTQSGKPQKQPSDKTYPTPPDDISPAPRKSAHSARAAAPPPVPKTTKGQRYMAPVGRHSQQTHRRALERAAAAGHATEKEQHDHDRSVVLAELNKRTQQQLKQQKREQNQPSAAQTGKAQQDPPGNKQA